MNKKNCCSKNSTKHLFRFLTSCELTFKITTEALNQANSWFSNSSLEIAEAILIGNVKVVSRNKIEVSISSFQSNDSLSMAKLRPDEITVPFFLIRGKPTSILSVDSILKNLKHLWDGISHQHALPFRFSDFLFIYAMAGFKYGLSEYSGISWFRVNAIVPNAVFELQKIKGYPVDNYCFRHCLETDSAVPRFQHLQPISIDKAKQKTRFGHFSMDPSGVLIPHLDDELADREFLPAGVWCTEGQSEGTERQMPVSSVGSFPIWLSLLRYAFSPKGQRDFSMAPFLAVHINNTRTLSFYSIQGDDSSRPFYSPILDFTHISNSHGYGKKLDFHLLSAFEVLESHSPRISSQRLNLNLKVVNPSCLPNKTDLAEYSKLFMAIEHLASLLKCPLQRGPLLRIATPKETSSANPPRHRSVKFRIPDSAESNGHQKGNKISTAFRFEVPEASLLDEEGGGRGYCAVRSGSAPNTRQYSPAAFAVSPQPLPCRQDSNHIPAPPCPQPKCPSNMTTSHGDEISRLEDLVKQLLAAQQATPSMSESKRLATSTASVGTNTPARQEVCSVAVNTSAVWPTPEEIGLVSPKAASTSVGTQCEEQEDPCQLQVVSPFAEDMPDLKHITPLTETSPKDQHQHVQLDVDLPVSPLSESCLGDADLERDLLPHSLQTNCNANTNSETGYSKLLAGIQRVLQTGASSSPLRKTVSVPGELSLLSVPAPLSARCPPTAVGCSTLEDAEADVVRLQRRCQQEVVAASAKIDFSQPSLLQPTPMPPQRWPSSSVPVKRKLKNSTPRPGQSEVSFPTAFISGLDSHELPAAETTTNTVTAAVSTKGTRKQPTDESVMLMGLARKYLPPSVIAQLAPSVSTTAIVEEEDASISRACGEFSLASRRYMKAHGLLSGVSEDDDEEGDASPHNLSSSSSSETVPRFTVLNDTTRLGEESFVPCSRPFFSSAVELSGAEDGEVGSYEAPVLNLEHLRGLPKLL